MQIDYLGQHIACRMIFLFLQRQPGLDLFPGSLCCCHRMIAVTYREGKHRLRIIYAIFCIEN